MSNIERTHNPSDQLLISKRKSTIILPLIVLAQIAGTSLWFTGNAILPELKAALNLSDYTVSLVTSAVMIGLIIGTLVIAFFSMADRFSPARLFFTSTLGGALFNLSIVWLAHDGASLFLLRFATGFFIAGIYPVGMKIAADWYQTGLGKAMAYLLGALVLGTAFPHLLKNRNFQFPYELVLIITSSFALLGGLLMLLLVGDGPFRKKSGVFRWDAIAVLFRVRKCRQAAFGYFGHMWELYTFWGFLPVILHYYSEKNKLSPDIPLLSFLIIASGSLGCIAGGYLSQYAGSAKVAASALLISGSCCLLSPLIFNFPPIMFYAFLFIWGLSVIPDSPQFSTLVALYSPTDLRGTALTVYNSIGFTISSFSLVAIDYLINATHLLRLPYTFAVLGIGAAFGLPSMIRLIRDESKE